MKNHSRIAFAFFLLFALTISLDAYLTCGRIRMTRKNGDGCNCHGEFASPNVVVQIFGPDSLAAGTSAQFTVAVFGGPDSSAGVNIAVSRGAIAPVDTTLCQIEDELTYAFPHPRPVDGAILWNFQYTAPLQSGNDTIWSVGNSVNLNGFPDGDQWNFGDNFYVNVFPSTNITEDEQVKPATFSLQTFPNPFNPVTTLSFVIGHSSFVNVSVYNVEGKKIATPFDEYKEAGTYSVEWNANEFVSGIYYAHLTVDNGKFSATKKLLLVK